MSTPVGDLAAAVKAGLGAALGTLGGLGPAERREAVARALGIRQLVPEQLVTRLAVAGADEAGRLWPACVRLLSDAVGRSRPEWNLVVPGVLAVDERRVDVLSPTLPAEIRLELRLGAVPFAAAVRADSASLALTIPADPAAAAVRFSLDGLRVALPDDALLDVLAPDGIELGGDLAARVDGSGVHFDGGGRDGVALPLDAAPALLRAPSLHLAPRGDAIRFTATFGAQLLGVLAGTVEGTGVELTPGPGGPVLTPVPPAGMGVELALGPVRGAGYLESQRDRYSGRLELDLGVVQVRAVGMLGTRPATLLAVLSAEFLPPIELGLAFTLNAVGGVVGVNHAIDRGGLAAAVQGGNLDEVLFPSDAVSAAPRVLATLASVFPVRAGSVVVGPLFRLGWGRPVSFLTADVGLVLELPSGVVALLGKLRVALPTPAAPIIDLRAAIAGVVDSANGVVEVTADLAGSRLVNAAVSGGLALRIKTGADAGFVLTAGGFHPRFPAPAGLPVPKRLSIALADSPLLQVVFTGYFAITPGTVQAGAALTVKIGGDDTGVSGRLGFDALVQWEPSFGLMLDLYGSFDLRVAGASLCSVDLRVRVAGPTPCWHVAGRASVSLFFFDVSFPFDEQWACTSQVTAPPVPDVTLLLERAVAEPRSWAPLPPPDAGALVALAPGGDTKRLLHPLGRLRFSQQVVPLDITITRFGPARLPVARQFRVTVGFSAGAGTATPVRERFARADFFDLTEDQRLTEPAFELLPAGAELTPPATGTMSPGRSVQVRYETKWIGEPGAAPKPGRGWLMTEEALGAAVRHGSVARGSAFIDRTRYAAAPLRRVLSDASYAIVDTDRLVQAADIRHGPTFTEATAALAAAPLGPVRLQVVPLYEVRK